MKTYSKNTLITVSILTLVIVCTVIYWFAKPQNIITADTAASNSEPVAQVETIKLLKGEIKESFTAYGVVLPLPDKLKTISVPYSSLIDKIQVNQGQIVEQGDLLLTLKSGADAVLQLGQAESELNAALRENKLLQERIHLKLATQQDLVTSRLRVQRAKVMLKNLTDRGIGKKQDIRAESAGIIYLSSVQQGQIVAAGAPLLQLVDQSQWVVRLGIEPENYGHLQVDQQVFITTVNTPVSEPLKGRIEIITHQIDPTTRLLNIFVRPQLNQTLLINDFVQGQIIISSVNTLLVPLQAVLPDDGGYSLFTIKNGQAVKHKVQVGLENDTHVELIHSDLKEQDEVVVLGNYELEPGMPVSVTTRNNLDKGVSK
jgi:RND family efflux transporter MFP subunit